jgi:neural Wiskott-Aldrich syndrome protein
MSEDLDRGVDELVNEAMRFFAREKGYLPTDNDGPRPTGRTSQAPSPSPPPPPARRPVQATPGSMRTSALPMRAAVPGQLPSPAAARPAPFEPPEEEEAPAPALYLLFQNQKYLVDKEQFIIGRGSKSSDLPIRDGNISRKHAAVIRRNGAYFIKDLGSTNGIDFNGVRIDNKRIEEGDVFNICDYELRFTFR